MAELLNGRWKAWAIAGIGLAVSFILFGVYFVFDKIDRVDTIDANYASLKEDMSRVRLTADSTKEEQGKRTNRLTALEAEVIYLRAMPERVTRLEVQIQALMAEVLLLKSRDK